MWKHRKDPGLRLITSHIGPESGLPPHAAEHTHPLDFGQQAVLKVR